MEPDPPFTAAGFWVREVRAVAASYFTACEEALRSSEINRIYRACQHWQEREFEETKESEREGLAHSMCSLILAVQSDDFNDAHLQQLVHARDLIKYLQDVLYRLRHSTVRQEHERVPLAGRV